MRRFYLLPLLTLSFACGSADPLGPVEVVDARLLGDVGETMTGIDAEASARLYQADGFARLQLVVEDARGAAMHVVMLRGLGDAATALSPGLDVELTDGIGQADDLELAFLACAGASSDAWREEVAVQHVSISMERGEGGTQILRWALNEQTSGAVTLAGARSDR
jgi:hypothetical protein